MSTIKIGQSIAAQIQRDRARRKLSQREYAIFLEIDQGRLSRLESGQGVPTIPTLQQISDKTGITFKITINPNI
jgi:transcriptional regulator with XRE-family HTH domain